MDKGLWQKPQLVESRLQIVQVQLVDIDTATVGQSLITKLLNASGDTTLAITRTGADAGTGVVSIAANIGTTAGTLVVGNDSRVVNAIKMGAVNTQPGSTQLKINSGLGAYFLIGETAIPSIKVTTQAVQIGSASQGAVFDTNTGRVGIGTGISNALDGTLNLKGQSVETTFILTPPAPSGAFSL